MLDAAVLTERPLMENETKRLIDALPGLIWAALSDGELAFLNQKWREYTGLDLEAAIGSGWQTAIHSEDLPALLEQWQSIRASGQSGKMEARLRRFDGEYRWFSIACNPVRDEEGQIATWYGINTDIEDCKLAEEVLQQRDLSFRLIVDSVPAPVAVTTPTGEVEALNQFTLDYFGKTFEELKSWKASEVVHPTDLEHTIKLQTEAHAQGLSYNVESRHLRADGVYRWFNVLGLPLRDPRGNIVRWFHLLIDIDDRKKAEEAQRRNEQEFQLLLDRVPFALAWSARPDGTAEFFNQQYLDFVGLSEEEARDWGWTTAVHPDDLNELAQSWQRILVSGKSGEAEARLRRHDGEYRWFLFRASPVPDEQGNITKWYGINTDIDDRRRSETLLRESEQRFRTIFDEAGAGISLLDLKRQTPIRNNRALQKMLCCTEDELGQLETFDQLTHEDGREKDAIAFRELCTGEIERLKVEKRFTLKDGSTIWANVIFTLLRDDDGSPRYVIAIHEDITERTLALKKLQANQELLDLAQKSAGAMAFDWYVQQEINYWSPEQEALFGLEPGSFDGSYKGWKKMMYAGDWPIVVNAIQHAHKTGKVTAEYRVVWPDGSLHWLSTDGRMFFDNEGQPFRMVGFTSDVTRRKEVEEKLKRSEAFLAEGQNLARMGNFSWRVATEDITWSEQLYRIYEFDTDTPITLALIGTRVHPDDVSLLQDMVEQAQRGVSDYEYEHRLLMPDYSVKYIHLLAHKSRDVQGRVEYLGAVQDVTQRRLAEEALGTARSELAQAAKIMSLGVLTASIAHEVNQPLAGIVTNASTCLRMLDADPPNVDGARETTRRTIRDGHRASDVITRLRALFSKKAAANEVVDLNDATREVIELTRTELQRNRVSLRTDFADDLPFVMGDRIQLQQVIMNLVRNASDAMAQSDYQPRHMTISTEVDDNDGVRLTVQDSGIGFEHATLNRLFDAFYTTKTEGMGMGLSVSRSIIENHQGRLWASANDGPGSTFSFSIPGVTKNRAEGENADSTL
jgi:PAS domain S-box-containing protein